MQRSALLVALCLHLYRRSIYSPASGGALWLEASARTVRVPMADVQSNVALLDRLGFGVSR